MTQTPHSPNLLSNSFFLCLILLPCQYYIYRYQYLNLTKKILLSFSISLESIFVFFHLAQKTIFILFHIADKVFFKHVIKNIIRQHTAILVLNFVYLSKSVFLPFSISPKQSLTVVVPIWYSTMFVFFVSSSIIYLLCRKDCVLQLLRLRNKRDKCRKYEIKNFIQHRAIVPVLFFCIFLNTYFNLSRILY